MAKLVECRDSLGITIPQTRTSRRSNGKWSLFCDSLCDSLGRLHKHLDTKFGEHEDSKHISGTKIDLDPVMPEFHSSVKL